MLASIAPAKDSPSNKRPWAAFIHEFERMFHRWNNLLANESPTVRTKLPMIEMCR